MTEHGDNPNGKSRFFYGWWIVAASMIGVSTCPQPFILGSLGLFMKPLTAEFGWTRSEISASVMVFTFTTALSFPVIGALIDRFGAKRVLLSSMFFLAACLTAISVFVTQVWHLVVVFFLIGTLGAGTNTISYVPVISNWFDRNRGLAIGISISGIGLGFFYVPLLVQFLIDSFGWRAGYFGLSAVILLIAMPLIAMIVREFPASMNLAPDGDEKSERNTDDQRSGLTVAETLRTVEFWLLAVTFTFISFVLNGLLTHLVPMLTDRDMSGTYAALIASSVGVTVFIGRIGIGYLIDRFFAPRLAVIFFGLSAIGLLTFAIGVSGDIAFVSAILIGLSLGAELDLTAYLASRYFGLRSFASIYGMLLAGIVCGGGLAPVAFGLWFDTQGSYVGILYVATILNLIAVLNMALLKPYPQWGDTAQ